MLSQQDLSQFKEILQPINDRLDKIDNKLTEHDAKFDKIDIQFAKIDAKFDKIDIQFAKIDAKFDKIDIQFKGVNKQLNKIQKDLTTTINYFDNNHITHEKRLDKIEKHLGFPQFSTI